MGTGVHMEMAFVQKQLAAVKIQIRINYEVGQDRML